MVLQNENGTKRTKFLFSSLPSFSCVTLHIGCPFMCKIADTSRVSVSLRNMELVAAGEVAQFEITVDGTANSELAVAVKGIRYLI